MLGCLRRQQSERRAHAGPAALRQLSRLRRAGALFSQRLGRWRSLERLSQERKASTPAAARPGAPGGQRGWGHPPHPPLRHDNPPRTRSPGRGWLRTARHLWQAMAMGKGTQEGRARRPAPGCWADDPGDQPDAPPAAQLPPGRHSEAAEPAWQLTFSPPTAAAAGPDRRVQRTPSRASQIRGKSEKFQSLQSAPPSSWHGNQVNL